MVRHTDDNDKNARPRQDDRARKPNSDPATSGPRYSVARPRIVDERPERPGGKGAFAKDGPRKDGPRKEGPPRKDGPRKDSKDAKTPAEPKRSERIAKAMARAGIASRREVERLIGLGKVALNGKILATPAVLVTRDDVITVDGKTIGSAQATRVWRYHKPAGLVTSHKDPAGRPTVFDALPGGLPRVISVGRLDLNTEGLLLLTNDGELSRALELPTSALVRQYRARARGRVTQEALDKLQDGVTVEGVRYGPIDAKLEKAKTLGEGERAGANLWISVSITEGKNREVRKVLESLGLTVNRLIRLAYGPFQLGTLPVGSVEEVGPRVIREMLSEHIRPDSLPQGNAVSTPTPVPGRRNNAPIVKGNSGSAISDPSRKPSRIRAAQDAATEGSARAETGKRPPKKEGWAKAAPRTASPHKAWKPREGEADKPKHFFKAGTASSASEGERPKRAFKPREDQMIGPKGTSRGPGDRPTRSFATRDGAAPRGAAPRGTDGPKRDFKPRTGPRPTGGKPTGPRKPRG
ncbi:pseudouridine synthase [uncultured Brevundimonas sp.]|uniref:pseudouridine synthase n=1 Tax=uncultured Brevundimonas sp. TaxID=213418 RepID=UPI0030EF19DF|tara:strand:+ start:10128 stop:11696 length:1569 start_codon:yes stop_codon:yes gene_type:complete